MKKVVSLVNKKVDNVDKIVTVPFINYIGYI